MAHEDYTDRRERQRQGIVLAKAAGRSGGRKGDRATHARIVALREAGKSIAKTAELADCDRSTVKRVWAAHRAAQVQEPSPQRNHRERNRGLPFLFGFKPVAAATGSPLLASPDCPPRKERPTRDRLFHTPPGRTAE